LLYRIQPVTSRPISGERFFVALCLREITFHQREMIANKLWGVCDEIILWEKVMKQKLDRGKEKENQNKNENEIGPENIGEIITEKNTEMSTMKNTGNSDNKSNEKSIENRKSDDDDNSFRFFWPFFFTQDESDNATNYLSAVNNSHIITQLIANYKILMLAKERGLCISDQNLMSEIGDIVIPTMGSENDGFEYYGKKEHFSQSENTVMECTDENSENENDSEGEIIYTKKTNKRRVANNKRRKQNKKNRNEDRERKRENKNNFIEDCDENEDRKVTFNSDINSSIMINHSENHENEISGNEIDKVIRENDLTDNKNTLENTDSNGDENKTHSHEDSNNSKNDATFVNFRKNGVFPVLRIRDLALLDEKKKTIRVHEYYKNWKIYDLDVVY
jgi:hypothetical protein